MAFKGSRLAILEWLNITSSKIMWVVIAAIAAMPLLYGALYLAAFSDPYERLNTVPVAVVNEDTGAMVDGEQRNLGSEIVDELKDDKDGLKWSFTTAAKAHEGLENGDYYMVCTIPANFSKDVASADTAHPQSALLTVAYNESKNLLASQIGESVWKEVRKRVSEEIAKGYWKTTFKSVADMGKDLQKAADGAEELADGLVDAQDGAGELASGAQTLLNGENTLGTGLGKLASGASSLDTGLTTLSKGTKAANTGANSLKKGLKKLATGTKQLKKGAKDVSDGAKTLRKEGTKALASGAETLAKSTEGLGKSTSALADGAQAVADGLKTASQSVGSSKKKGKTLAYTSATVTSGLSDLKTGITSAKQGLDATDKELEKVADGLEALGNAQLAESIRAIVVQQQKVSGGLGQLSDGIGSAKKPGNTLAYGSASVTKGLDTLSTGLGNAKTGASQVAAGAKKLADAAPSLEEGIQSLKTGADQVDSNMATLAAGAKSLSSGATKVNTGAVSARDGAKELASGTKSLRSGAKKAADGASALASGVQSAKSGSGELANGAARLQAGASSLETGLTPAIDGATELGEKLAEGAQTAEEQASDRNAKAAMMSDPVKLVKDEFTSVKNYGTGFAPYFMALGLWVGALVAGFVFRPLNRRAVLSGGSPLLASFSSFLPMAFFSIIQATLLMVVLQFGLQLQIDNVPLFYAFGYLTAVVFAAIMQLLSAALGFPGKFLAIILLMLQLTSCAGTFPIETTPDFFQAVYPFMPMTYVVEGMRQIMTGFNFGLVQMDFIVIACIGLGAFALTCVVAHRKKTLRMDDLHPLLQLGQ